MSGNLFQIDKINCSPLYVNCQRTGCNVVMVVMAALTQAALEGGLGRMLSIGQGAGVGFGAPRNMEPGGLVADQPTRSRCRNRADCSRRANDAAAQNSTMPAAVPTIFVSRSARDELLVGR